MNNEFDNLSLNSILTLVELLAVTRSEELVYIRRRFEENALGFNETAKFLATMNLVQYDKEIIKRTQEFQDLLNKISLTKSLVVQYIIELMLDSNNIISRTVREYLSNFTINDDSLIYKPLSKQRRKESGIRNLLIEFGIIDYSDTERAYYIAEEYLPVLVKKAQILYQYPKELDYLLKKQKEIGAAAELAVFEYEKKRLEKRPEFLEEIQLISHVNVKAGYDIKSYELESSKDSPIFRYIEVKTVSLTDYKFFWSRNEIEVAKSYGERYYLYLLPVLKQGVFDLSKLDIIPNPYENVFHSKNKWAKVEELYSFSK